MAGRTRTQGSSAKDRADDGGGRRFSPRRLPFLLTVVVVGYLLFSLSGQFMELAKMESQVRGMQQQVKSLQTKNQALTKQLQLIKSDAYIEQVARQRLGLVKPGEHPVLPVTKGGRKSN